MTTKVCVAGAAGWAGSALSVGISRAPDMELVAAVSRTHAGRELGAVLDIAGLTTPVSATATEALARKPDVFVEYTKSDVAKTHVVIALGAGAHVVIGTSGLTEDDYREIDAVLATMAAAARLGIGRHDGAGRGTRARSDGTRRHPHPAWTPAPDSCDRPPENVLAERTATLSPRDRSS